MLTHRIAEQTDNSSSGLSGQAAYCCQRAREFEESGNYEAGISALRELWPSVRDWPQVEQLDAYTAAELLLRAGSLSVFAGVAEHHCGGYESAKNFISAGIELFEGLGDRQKVVEARTALAHCYAREGDHDNARAILRQALTELGTSEGEREQRLATLLRSSMVEASATRFNEALNLLLEAAPLAETITDNVKKGQFHAHFAIVLETLGAGENRADYIDRAFIEHAAASFHFEQAGHTRYYACGQNNLGLLHFKAGRFAEAQQHLEHARRLYISLNDTEPVAQVDDTRARILLGQQEIEMAESVASGAVKALEVGGQQGLLAEALTTWGTALARLGRRSEARGVLQRAFEVAQQAGDFEGAGLAELTTLEELRDQLTRAELRASYELADQLLARTQHPGILERLRACARRVIAAEHTLNIEFDTLGFAYGSEQMAALLREAHSIAHAPGAVLLTGETGTGKELLARLMHEWSGRAGQFVALNCATLSDTLIESQLFGHVKGSFTDAAQDYPGAARLAAGGTLFLDEIAELSVVNQSKLLRFIEYGEIHTVGVASPERIDVRVLAATNRPVETEIAEGRFRADLFYRLQNFRLDLPPLRARVEDIPAIANHFIRHAMKQQDKHVRFAPGAIEAMCRLPLAGNARELRSLIERTVLAAGDGSIIEAGAVETVALRLTGKADFAAPWAHFSLKEEVQRFEEQLIEKALHDAEGKVSHAARLLGFRHHEALNWRLKNRNKNLISARIPAKPRKRSIICK